MTQTPDTKPGKPWGGGTTLREFRDVTLRDLARAVPELREALGLDYLGNPKVEEKVR